MPENATIYAPLYGFPATAQLEGLAPAASVTVDGHSAELEWPSGTSAVLTRMPDDEMGVHLTGLCELVRNRGVSEAVPIRILSTTSVLSLVVEPAHDDDSLGFVARLAIETNGFFFLDGQLTDCDGTDLLSPSRPSAERVARRALILLSLAFRGLLEQDAGTPEQHDAEALRGELEDWVRAQSLADEAEPHELAVLCAPIGEPPPQPVIEAVWRAEGAQVLLWALAVRELPPHDAQEHPFEVCREIGVLSDAPLALLSGPMLRPDDELEWMRRRLLALNWRMTNQRVRPGPVDFAAFADNNWFGGFDLAGIALAGGDLAVGGASLSAADVAHIDLTTSSALERHLAINWVVGAHPVYSAVVTPT